MAVIHFAFGRHHRAGERGQQVSAFVDHILATRRLRASVCPEFLPVLSAPGDMVQTAAAASDMGGGIVMFNKPEHFVPAPPVRLLPEDVPMISFVNIPFNRLSRWAPSHHYGRLGIAFTDDFRRRADIRSVTYYQHSDLTRDPLVIRLNRELALPPDQRQKLTADVVHYRKPARFWPEFNKLITAVTITFQHDGTSTVEDLNYSRYEIGYNFEEEREARKVMSGSDLDLAFEETDVLAVIVPDAHAAESITGFLKTAWKTQPNVMVYPNERSGR